MKIMSAARTWIAFQWLLSLVLGVVSMAAGAGTPLPRVVCAGGALTEIVYALGAQDQLVGVDTTSRWPVAARELPQVGYQRSLSAEGVLSLTPTLLLATTDAGPPDVIEQIRRAGVEVKILSAAPDTQAILDKVRGVAAALQRSAAGEKLVAQITHDLERTQQAITGIESQPRVLFLLAVGRGAPLASGTDTAADTMIRMAGARNALEGFSNYKPIGAEAMVAAAPDVVLLSEDSLAQLGGIDAVLALPGVALTPAGRQRRILTMDGLYLLGFGPRQPQALQDLAMLLHPSLAPSAQAHE
jgi:iron complex transport system substrate-binding protein